MNLQSVGFTCKKCKRILLNVEFVSVVKISSQNLSLFCLECNCSTTHLISSNSTTPASFSVGLKNEDQLSSSKIFLKEVIEN